MAKRKNKVKTRRMPPPSEAKLGTKVHETKRWEPSIDEVEQCFVCLKYESTNEGIVIDNRFVCLEHSNIIDLTNDNK